MTWANANPSVEFRRFARASNRDETAIEKNGRGSGGLRCLGKRRGLRGAGCWPHCECKDKIKLRHQFSPKQASSPTKARPVTPWPETLETSVRMAASGASQCKRRMMFRSEALRTRYIIRSGTLQVMLEAFDSESRWLVAGLVRFEALRLELPSGLALIARFEALPVTALR